jgi:hypothetical protein
VPFICECADPTCMEVLRVELDEYRSVRSSPRRFLKAASHGADAGPAARLVSEHEGYVVVEKLGRAGDVAESLARGHASEA